MFVIERAEADSSASTQTWDELHGTHYVVSNWELKKSREGIGTLTFNVYPDNPAYYEYLTPLTTLIRAYESTASWETSQKRFYGRICGVKPQMDPSGRVYKQVTCESCEAFMLDTFVDMDTKSAIWAGIQSQYKPASVFKSGTYTLYDDGSYAIPASVMMHMAVDYHNATAGAVYKHITLNTTGAWSTSTLFVRPQNDNKTWDYIKSIVNDTGAEAFMTYNAQNDTITLNIGDPSSETSGIIALADNMISCAQDITPSEVCSAIRLSSGTYSETETISAYGEVDFAHDVTLALVLDSVPNARTWLASVLNTFNATYWDASTVHRFYDSSVTGDLIEGNALDAYGEVRYMLNVDGLADFAGWNTVEEGETPPTIAEWLSDNITEGAFKKWVTIALRYFDAHDRIVPGVELSAADVALIDNDYSLLDINTWWTVTNSLIGLNDRLEIVEITWSQGTEHTPSISLGRSPSRAIDMNIHALRVAESAETTATEASSKADSASKAAGSSSSGGGSGDGYKHEFVATLPARPEANTIYFVHGTNWS